MIFHLFWQSLRPVREDWEVSCVSFFLRRLHLSASGSSELSES